MKPDGVANRPLGVLRRGAGGDAAGQVGNALTGARSAVASATPSACADATYSQSYAERPLRAASCSTLSEFGSCSRPAISASASDCTA